MSTIAQLTEPMRHATDRGRIVGRLQDVADARLDLTGPQSAFSVNDACDTATIQIDEPIVTADGVTVGAVEAVLCRSAWRNLSTRLQIPGAYLDRLIDGKNGDLAATNVNTLSARDNRSALYRLLRGTDGFALRAVLSDRFLAYDNLDVLTATAAGMTQADLSLLDCEIDADWTTDRFRMRVAVPQIQTLAPDLLAGYRWPFSHARDGGMHDPARPGEIPPVVWAGLEITNGETGGAAFSIVPRMVVLVCKNGLTRPVDAMRKVHIGGRLEQGTVDWSAETYRKSLDLITSQIADATKTFCSVGYLDKSLDEMRVAKGIEVVDAPRTMEVVQQRLGFTDEETKSVLDAFMRGGDFTVLGVGQAVTAAAQHVEDGDRQSEMEATFWQIVQAPAVFA